MIGKTNFGYCFRENALWYDDAKTIYGETPPCRLPLTDGSPCGDTSTNGVRCPYNRKEEQPDVDYEKLHFITYPQANKK